MSGATKLMTAGGGGVNITAASSIASDVTVNVPSQNCTLGIQGPAFSAYRNVNQTGNAVNTFVKVKLNAETFDTNNCFDSVTNYRFTPNVAGYYQIEGAVAAAVQANNYVQSHIYKNGVDFAQGLTSSVNGPYATIPVSRLIYFNGTTDYVELYFYSAGTGTYDIYLGPNTYLQGVLVRAA